MTFENIVRRWCKTHKHIRDSRKNRRFFFTDSRENMIEMAKQWTPKMSPLVVMECVAEGSGKIERPSMNYPIYFFVRAERQKDGDAAWTAVKDALEYACKFLGWLKTKHDQEMDENRDGDFARINLDNALITIDTIGPLGDGWYAVLIQLDRDEPLNLCVDWNEYDDECECDEDDDDGEG